MYIKYENKKVRCIACGHRCLINENKRGICRVRFNRDGKLYVPWGYVAGLQLDPIEKKPFFHALPGSKSLTFGMLGCNFHCSYCQNWVSSQALRDPVAGFIPDQIESHDIVKIALKYDAKSITSSYNEPLITSEWAKSIFELAKKHNLRTFFVSNGNATEEVLNYLRPYLDGYKIDFKTFDDKKYRWLGGVLRNILNTIELTYKMGFWVEIVTLVVPGFNDSPQEIREMAKFIASVSKDIPWHLTAFHSDYKMLDTPNTNPYTLLKLAEIAKEEGIRFVYLGNLPGMVEEFENTYCPICNELLIERWGFRILKNKLTPEGTCPKCNEKIPGIWS